ncbi:hypothetical protein [Microbacterium candidum]|uniref:Uncharacterized protein n=1 Tax=Microbacterium candidum TaxID=3041922 RepID=A0ABT7MWM8_9MICO|nr:hypothetical protein [Microbacterium sp. ASV49]MDL9978838.1 hypothetical protein [Microbacterium sp. ASV49]
MATTEPTVLDLARPMVDAYARAVDETTLRFLTEATEYDDGNGMTVSPIADATTQRRRLAGRCGMPMHNACTCVRYAGHNGACNCRYGHALPGDPDRVRVERSADPYDNRTGMPWLVMKGERVMIRTATWANAMDWAKAFV